MGSYFDFDDMDDNGVALAGPGGASKPAAAADEAAAAATGGAAQEELEAEAERELLAGATVESLSQALVDERRQRRSLEQRLEALASEMGKLRARLDDAPGLWELGGQQPSIHPTAYVAPGASVIGNVHLGKDASVWFNCTLRGDNDVIRIGDGSDVQDNSILHCDEGKPLIIGKNVLVGHQVCLHGCRIGNNCLIGMRSTILDNARIGNNCFIAAGSFIPEGKQIPDNSFVQGNPAKRIDLLPEQRPMLEMAAGTYVVNKDRFQKELRPFSP